ncbi:MAG: hypothetical protein K2J75_02575, partial [Clostridia bacterium]|nr:hypothetical protein [Clostridia bacterium]
MINLISALTLTAKLGICIAVFAVLIVAEILALVMLVKWKKNYKSAVAVKETSNVQNTTEEIPQTVREEALEEQPQEGKDEEIAPAEAQETITEDTPAENEPLGSIEDSQVENVTETESAEVVEESQDAEVAE